MIPRPPRYRPNSVFVLALFLGALAALPPAQADQVILKNGALIRGNVERENALITIFDGLKKTVIRHTQVDRITPEPASERKQLERFSLVQPLEVHGGEMPSHALRLRATPWDEFGQRMFEYSRYTGGQTLRTVRMKQAINEIGPDIVRYRGIDGFWLGQIATSQVPRDVILGLLDRVDPSNKNERLRVGRFLIQAGWYDEALAELDRLANLYPELSGTVETVRRTIRDLEAEKLLGEVDRLLEVRQPRAAEAQLMMFPADRVSPPLRDRIDRRKAELRESSDASGILASEIRAALDQLSEELRQELRPATFEVLQALDEAPDAASARLSASSDPTPQEEDAELAPEVQLARTLSTWLLGPKHAIDDPEAVVALWEIRDRIVSYLASSEAGERERLLAEFGETSEPEGEAQSASIDLETISRIIRRLPPPLASEEPPTPGVPLIRRVIDDVNPTPTEYAVLLPPEYHPLRSYPTLVALHDGRGTGSALEWWGEEALRNGFIVIAPEYMNSGEETPDYRYSADENAAVLLTLRDALKRFSIDPDRVYLGGSLMGGHAAWDIGLAHPDVFAGVVTLSGIPAKYVARTRAHGAYVPLYIVIGDLATASTEALVFDLAKSMMGKAWDVTYVEYHRRGLEPLPEELPSAFDWMKRRTRTPHRKDFEVVSCRTSDDRFHGLVIQDYLPGRTPAPETVDVLGKKLDPARISCKISTLSNLLSLSLSGISAIDIWITPEYFDFDERIQIRINGKRYFNDWVEPSLEALLEDVRIRGDRQQLYWAKIPLGGKRAG